MLLNISHQVRGRSLSSSSLSPLPSATLCFNWSSCWRPCLVLLHWRLELMQPHSHTHASYQLIYSLGTYYYYYICFLFFFYGSTVSWSLNPWILQQCGLDPQSTPQMLPNCTPSPNKNRGKQTLSRIFEESKIRFRGHPSRHCPDLGGSTDIHRITRFQ